MSPKIQEGWVVSILRRQGMSFLLLALAVYFLQKENNSIRKEILSCEKEKIELLKEQNRSLEKVINVNTMAVTTLNEYIKSMVEKPKKVSTEIDPAFKNSRNK